MIRLIRQRDTSAIPIGFRGAGRLESERRLLVAKRIHFQALSVKPHTSPNFPSAWWSNAKPTLRREAKGKCAYCEARADAVAYCDVEHIRPKSVWWWLTCCWDNYCFACQLCNQKFKLDHFPLAGLPGRPPQFSATSSDAKLDSLIGTLAPDPLDHTSVISFSKRLAKEKPLLPHPYFDDPESILAWEVDDLNSHIRLIPRNNTTHARKAVAACESFLGLNREELCELRYETYETLELVKETLTIGNLSSAKRVELLRKLEKFIDARHAFAAMSRYFLCDVWQLLPRPS